MSGIKWDRVRLKRWIGKCRRRCVFGKNLFGCVDANSGLNRCEWDQVQGTRLGHEDPLELCVVDVLDVLRVAVGVRDVEVHPVSKHVHEVHDSEKPTTYESLADNSVKELHGLIHFTKSSRRPSVPLVI